MGYTHTLDFGGVLARVLLCVFVVFSAYNVSGYSYFHWVTSDQLQPPAEHVLQIAVAGALGAEAPWGEKPSRIAAAVPPVMMQAAE